MSKKYYTAACVLPVLSLLMIAGGCGVETPHPNQINAFDGASYDTMTLAHGALTSLRPQIAVNQTKYNALFNQTAEAYNAAFIGYSAFRENPASQADMAVAVTDLTTAIIDLEAAFETDMQVTPADAVRIRKKAEQIRRTTTSEAINVADILTELEIAAAVARAVPAAAPYANLAQIVISSTTAALNAAQTASGQPIDLSTIQAIQLIQ